MPNLNIILLMIITLASGTSIYAEKAKTKSTVDPYDALYDAILHRNSKDGKIHGSDEAAPLIYENSNFPFDPISFKTFEPALKAFDRLPDATIQKYSPVKRVLLQQHLLMVYHGVFPKLNSSFNVPNNNRVKVIARLSSLMRRLGLTKKEIQALPHTGRATIQSGKFPSKLTSNDSQKPFLPDDLFSKKSDWVCVGKTSGTKNRFVAFTDRSSAIFQFVKVPGGRFETLKSIEALNRGKAFPVGTQFALIEQPFLLTNERRSVLSPLVSRIHLRIQTDQKKNISKVLAEFTLNPRELIKGNAELGVINKNEKQWRAICSLGRKDDPFENGENGPKHSPMGCEDGHDQTKIPSWIQFNTRGSFKFKAVNLAEITECTKREVFGNNRGASIAKFWWSRSAD